MAKEAREPEEVFLEGSQGAAIGKGFSAIYIYIYIYIYIIRVLRARAPRKPQKSMAEPLPKTMKIMCFNPSGAEMDVRNGFGGSFCSGLHVSDVRKLRQEPKTLYFDACLRQSVRQKLQNMRFLVDLLKSVNWLHF